MAWNNKCVQGGIIIVAVIMTVVKGVIELLLSSVGRVFGDIHGMMKVIRSACNLHR